MRVSTKNHGQTTETQALALREYAAHRGFTIVEEYRDEGISGSKDSRPALDRLMKDPRCRKFDVVIVARFDRFARSVSHLLRDVKSLLWPEVMSSDLANHFPDWEVSTKMLEEKIQENDDAYAKLISDAEALIDTPRLADHWREVVALSVVGHCLGRTEGMTLALSPLGYAFTYAGGGMSNCCGTPSNPIRPTTEQLLAFRAYQKFQQSIKESGFAAKCEQLREHDGAMSEHARQMSEKALLLSQITSLHGTCEFIKID